MGYQTDDCLHAGESDSVSNPFSFLALARRVSRFESSSWSSTTFPTREVLESAGVVGAGVGDMVRLPSP